MNETTASVKDHQGIPTLHINGQPFMGWTYMRAMERYPGYDTYTWEDVARDYAKQAQAGAGLFMFHASCAGDFYERLWGDVWLPDGTFDFSHLDRFMEIFRRSAPGVWVMPKINMFLPAWWEERHPEEIQRFADGRTRARYHGESAANRDQVVSLASEKWAADMTHCLEHFLDYAEERYGSEIIGAVICGGITHEWGILGSFDFVDYSAPMQRYWKNWVENRYNGNAPYDGGVIPSPELRDEGVGRFRNPSRSQAAIDFQLCLSDLVVDRITGFCETVKRRSGGRKIAATYYGYTITCREGGLDKHGQFLGRYGCGGFQGGHLAMNRLLKCPAIDMITSPPTYMNRRLGVGDMQPHYAETSVTNSGKISFFQDDNRSWKGYDQKTIDTGFYPEPENFLKQLRRSFAMRMCGDHQFYLMDLLGDNYDDPRVIDELRHEQALFEKYFDHRSKALAELLVVVDEIAIAHLSLISDLQMNNVYRQSIQWARCGVPYHVVLVEDAAEMDLSSYSLVMMCNSVVASGPVTKLVGCCRESGVSLLFLPDCGVLGPDGPDEALGVALRGGARSSGFDEVAATAPIGWEEIGKLAARAGCHRYGTRGERIWRSPHLLGVHVDSAGDYQIELPAGSAIESEILSGIPWKITGTTLSFCMEQWQTAIFVLSGGGE
jgi:hypothetical protein